MDNVSQAGAVVFEHCEILKLNGPGLDIINQVEGVVIYEDMFSPFITGELHIRDTIDLPNILGRSGQDIVKLKIYTPGIQKEYTIDGVFFIYKMADKAMVKDRAQTYKLHFASYEMSNDIQTRISKKFSGSGDKISEVLVREYFRTNKKLYSDNPTNNINFVSNFWSPSKCMSFVSEHSIRKNVPGFVFFENRDGFNFKSIEAIGSKDLPYMQKFQATDFIASIESEGANTAKASRDPINDYKSITGLRVDVNYDFINDYMNGGIHSKLYSSDITTKKIRWNVFDINAGLSPILNDRKLYSDDVVKSTNPLVLSKTRGYGVFGLNEPSNYSFLQRRISQMNMFQASKIEIDAYGRTDYTVGKRVSIDINQVRNITKNEAASDYLDRTVSGNYIVTAVAHTITRISHKCTFELCKESTLLK